MEYNTQRKKLNIGDYGRMVAKLVREAEAIPDRERRTEAAQAIVATMARVRPEAMGQADSERRLWEHLMIISEGRLKVDTPYPIEEREQLKFAPRKMTHHESRPASPHIGRSVEKMIARVAEMEEGEEKEQLVEEIMRQLKISHLQWSGELADDEVIKHQFEKLSHGRISCENVRPITVSQMTVKAIAAEKKMSSKKKRRK